MSLASLLRTELPIVQAPMGWIARSQLASAVANAGGLGIITGLTQKTPELLAREIAPEWHGASGWIEEYRRFWEQSFDRLDAYLRQVQRQPQPRTRPRKK